MGHNQHLHNKEQDLEPIHAALFEEAKRGHLMLFEPVRSERSVQFYHIRFLEVLAAEAWSRQTDAPAIQSKFEKACSNQSLRGAFHFLLGVQNPEECKIRVKNEITVLKQKHLGPAKYPHWWRKIRCNTFSAKILIHF